MPLRGAEGQEDGRGAPRIVLGAQGQVGLWRVLGGVGVREGSVGFACHG